MQYCTAGLLPDAGNDGYQYNRPSSGIAGEAGRRVGYDASGRFLPSGNGFDLAARPSGTYGVAGFGGFPGAGGYGARPSGAYPGGYNGAFPGGVPPPGYEGIPQAYRNGYNGDNGPVSFIYLTIIINNIIPFIVMHNGRWLVKFDLPSENR